MKLPLTVVTELLQLKSQVTVNNNLINIVFHRMESMLKIITIELFKRTTIIEVMNINVINNNCGLFKCRPRNSIRGCSFCFWNSAPPSPYYPALHLQTTKGEEKEGSGCDTKR